MELFLTGKVARKRQAVTTPTGGRGDAGPFAGGKTGWLMPAENCRRHTAI